MRLERSCTTPPTQYTPKIQKPSFYQTCFIDVNDPILIIALRGVRRSQKSSDKNWSISKKATLITGHRTELLVQTTIIPIDLDWHSYLDFWRNRRSTTVVECVKRSCAEPVSCRARTGAVFQVFENSREERTEGTLPVFKPSQLPTGPQSARYESDLSGDDSRVRNCLEAFSWESSKINLFPFSPANLCLYQLPQPRAVADPYVKR